MRCDIRRQKDISIVTPCDTIVFCFWSRPKENEEQFLRQSMRKRRIKKRQEFIEMIFSTSPVSWSPNHKMNLFLKWGLETMLSQEVTVSFKGSTQSLLCCEC